MPADAFSDVQDHRDGAQRLGEATGAGGLLADAAALEREGLVDAAGGLPADAQLQQHEVGAVHRGVQVGRGDHPAGVVLPLEHPAGDTTDELEALLRRGR